MWTCVYVKRSIKTIVYKIYFLANVKYYPTKYLFILTDYKFTLKIVDFYIIMVFPTFGFIIVQKIKSVLTDLLTYELYKRIFNNNNNN